MVLFVVLFLGTSINVANTHPHNLADVETSLIQQVVHPAISAADYSTLNK